MPPDYYVANNFAVNPSNFAQRLLNWLHCLRKRLSVFAIVGAAPVYNR